VGYRFRAGATVLPWWRNVAIAVTMNVGKGSTRSGVKATTAADTMKSGTKSV
jgi:hypothetical protein